MAKENQNNSEPARVEISNEELKTLMQENLALLKETHEMIHKIKSYITFQKVMSLVYLVLILGPIIFSILYLPPILKQIFGQYSDLLNMGSPSALFEEVNSEILKNK